MDSPLQVIKRSINLDVYIDISPHNLLQPEKSTNLNVIDILVYVHTYITHVKVTSTSKVPGCNDISSLAKSKIG